ncbi:MAG: hypothetical protein JO227_07215 [Acetobacteraceae bacterium]|nr:hypothetical protein [Acetobacteraceae bacterium]
MPDGAPLYYWTVWWTPLLLFLAALGLLHAVLIYSPLRLSSRGWKKVDYIWLTMSVFSIIGFVSQSRQTINTNYTPWMERQVRNSGSFVADALRDAAQLSCNVHFVKSDISPPNFDEIVQQGESYCAYVHDLQAKFQPVVSDGKPIEHAFTSDPKFPLAYGADFNQPRIETWVANYNSNLQLLRTTKEASQRSDMEIALALIAPFLIAAALALRMTKVTADLRQDTRTSSGQSE